MILGSRRNCAGRPDSCCRFKMTFQRLLFLCATSAFMAGCAPRVAPLKGALAPNRSLPNIQLASQHRHVAFRWNYEENSLLTNGEGAIRASAPDSARVHLFLNGGDATGYAILIGD